MGYEPVCTKLFINPDKDPSVMELPVVTMCPQLQSLGEVYVEGKSFIRKEDRVLVFPNVLQVKQAGTGYDLLYNLMIPGVSVEPHKGKVTSFGNEVALYIDGRKAGQREIMNLRPRDVEKIEYFDMPTGKYAGDFASVNYITKQKDSGGYVAIDGTQTMGYLMGDYNAVAKVNKKNTSFTIFAGHQMFERDGDKEERREEFRLGGYDVYRYSQTMDSRVKGNNQYCQLYLSNNAKNHSLTSRLSLVRDDRPRDYQRKMNLYRGGTAGTQYSETNTWQKSLMPELYLYGSFTMKGNRQLEISLTGSYTDNDYSRTYDEGGIRAVTDVDEDFYSLNVNANYILAMKKGSSLAFKLFHFHKVSSSTYSDNAWQHLWSGETLLFMEYKKPLSRRVNLRIQPGLSSLQYKLHGEKRISRISPRLQMNMGIMPARNQFVQIGANVGNSFPQINTMNTVSQTMDMFQIRRGNAQMDKTNLYLINAAHGFQSKKIGTQVAFSYLFANNMPTNCYYVEDNKLVNSYHDGNKHHNLQIFLSSTWKICRQLNVKLDTYFIRSILTGNTSFTSSAFVGILDVNYYLKDFLFNVNGVLPRYSMGDYYNLNHQKIHGEYGGKIGWSKKSWRTEVGVCNPFCKRNRVKSWLDTEPYRFNSALVEAVNQQTGYIKVAYTLDFGRKTAHEENKAGRTTNSAIMK